MDPFQNTLGNIKLLKMIEEKFVSFHGGSLARACPRPSAVAEWILCIRPWHSMRCQFNLTMLLAQEVNYTGGHKCMVNLHVIWVCIHILIVFIHDMLSVGHI